MFYREKSEAAKKFEELVSSVQASVSTITNERDQLRKQNSQATELLKVRGSKLTFARV